MPGINQIQVKPQIDLTFANALRSIVRQDPDVIMIGEIRDLETAQIAVQSALTGHLVLSTVHTNDAAVDRQPPARHGRRGLPAHVDRDRHPRAAPRAHALPALQGAVHGAARDRRRSSASTASRRDGATSRCSARRAAPQCAQTGYIGPRRHHRDAADDRSAAQPRDEARDLDASCAPRRMREGMLSMYEDGLRKALARRDDVRGSAARHARELSMAGLARCPSIATGRQPGGRGRRSASSTPPTRREIVDRLRDQGLMPMQIARASGAAAAAGGAQRARRGAALFESKTRHARPAARRSRASSRRCCARGCRSTARSRS